MLRGAIGSGRRVDETERESKLQNMLYAWWPRLMGEYRVEIEFEMEIVLLLLSQSSSLFVVCARRCRRNCLACVLRDELTNWNGEHPG